MAGCILRSESIPGTDCDNVIEAGYLFKLWRGLVVLGAIVCVNGCGQFFAEKPTDIQSRAIISELSKIATQSDPNAPVLDIYRDPPKILETKRGFKLFYFARHQSIHDVNTIIKEQLHNRVSLNPPLNQLVIECATNEEAQSVLAFLEKVDVAPIQVKIDCLVSELAADVTMDWETTIQIEDLFGESLTLGGKVVGNTVLPAFPGASLREPARQQSGLKIGFSDLTGDRFQALVDVLVSRGYLKILMSPSLEVANGQTAEIKARDQVPLRKEVITGTDVEPYLTTVYEWVEDSLLITPHVFADGYIGLETQVTIGSKSTPVGINQTSHITRRSINNRDNRIRQGQSLIIGGFRKTEKRSVIRGVPFLKDIPIIGILFSSKDFEERAREVLFIITPTISNQGVPTRDMVETIEKKHEPPVSEEVHEAVMESLGLGGVSGILTGTDPDDGTAESKKSSEVGQDSADNADQGKGTSVIEDD
jgi:type II secretory pathway component GspD/PulD (secretin)